MDDFTNAKFEIGNPLFVQKTKAGRYQYLVKISCIGARKYTTLYYEVKGGSVNQSKARQNALNKAKKLVAQLKEER